MRLRGKAPARLRMQHDQFRTRLDMYCVLTLGSLNLVWIAPLILWNVPAQSGPILLSMGGFDITEDLVVKIALAASMVMISWASYQAAIASARGYVTILRQMDRL